MSCLFKKIYFLILNERNKGLVARLPLAATERGVGLNACNNIYK